MKDLINEIIPPEMGPVARWRLAIFVVCVILLTFMGWALSPIGFARAGDFDKTTGLVQEIRIAQVEQYLFDAKESECSSENLEARKFFSKRVLSLNREYSQMAGMKMDIPPCPKNR